MEETTTKESSNNKGQQQVQTQLTVSMAALTSLVAPPPFEGVCFISSYAGHP